MSQSTQKNTDTEQVTKSTNESESEQQSTDIEQETEDSTDKPESKSNGGC